MGIGAETQAKGAVLVNLCGLIRLQELVAYKVTEVNCERRSEL